MSKRRCDYDFLRVLCMAGVVYLHTAAGALRSASGVLWHFANMVTSLATAAVPLFFMLSGALMLSDGSTTDLPTLFRKRLPKVLIPLLAWSAIVLLRTLYQEGGATALGALLALPSTPVLVPYWFLYALVPMYLLVPLLSKMADGLTDAQWNYLVGLWLLLTIGFTTLRVFLPEGSPLRTAVTLHWTLNLDMIGGYLGYFLLGARLARLKTMPSRALLWAVAATSYLIIAFGTFFDLKRGGFYNERFKNYLYIFCAVLAIALFLLCRSYLQNKTAPWGLVLCSGLSFGVYLAHPLAIKFWGIAWPQLFGSTVTTLGQHLLFYGLVLACCIAGTLVVSSVGPLCYPLTGQRFSAACRDSNLFALFHPKKH